MQSNGKHIMNHSIPFILLSLGGKCVLNWALVFLQRNHICRSFVGVFSVSLAVVDTAMTLIFTIIYLHGDERCFLLGLQLTKYHICLLVQIIGEVYSVLQYPVVVMAGLDHFCTTSQRLQLATSRLKWIFKSFVTIIVWCLALLYIFLLCDFLPVLENVSHHQIYQCWVFHDFRLLRVAMLIFLTLGSAIFFTRCSPRLFKNHRQGNQITDQRRSDLRRSVVSQALGIFLNTWAIFLFFLAALLVLPVGIPSYLGLNVAWLCFLNSLLIGVVLCVVCPASELAQGLAAVPPDSFCEWKFKFSLAKEDSS